MKSAGRFYFLAFFIILGKGKSTIEVRAKVEIICKFRPIVTPIYNFSIQHVIPDFSDVC